VVLFITPPYSDGWVYGKGVPPVRVSGASYTVTALLVKSFQEGRRFSVDVFASEMNTRYEIRDDESDVTPPVIIFV
jgi:hypothetical protein